MKFEKMVIKCENLEQRDIVIDNLIALGYSQSGNCVDMLFIHTYSRGSFHGYVNGSHHNGATHYTFKEFMEKYMNNSNEMKTLIEKTLFDFKMNREELSKAIGMSKSYITKMLTLPQSEKVQKKVINLVNEFIDKSKPVPVKDKPVSIGEICVDLTLDPKFQEVIDDVKVNVEKCVSENDQLRKELDHKNQILDKRNDKLADAEYEINAMKKTIDSMRNVLNEDNQLRQKHLNECWILITIICLIIAFSILSHVI